MKGIFKAILWIVGVWLALLVILETVLSQSVLTDIVNRYASEYVDGELKFGKVSASMFRRFPSATLTLEDFSVTYPAERFDNREAEGVQSHLIRRGCGQECDTLASFRKFSVSLNLPALFTGTINIPDVRLDRPRIFAHAYADGSANWEIFRLESSDDTKSDTEDTTEVSSPMPKLVLGRIRMSGNPHIVYTDSRDTIFAMVNIRKMGFTGKINTRRVTRSRVGLTLDSMLVAGRIGRDTLSVGLDKLHLHEHDGHIDVSAAAKAYMATMGFGRMMVPVDINGVLSATRGNAPSLKAENFKIDLAYIPITAQAQLHFNEGSTSITAEMGIDRCSVADLLDKYADNFMPELKQFDIDAEVSVKASCKGYYDHATGTLPDFAVSIDHFGVVAGGLDLQAVGKVDDLFGSDPKIEIDGGMLADIDSLARFFPDEMDIKAAGAAEAHIKGSAKLSELNLYNFSKSSLTGEITGDGIDISIPSDTVTVVVDGLKITLGPKTFTSRRDPSRSVKLMGMTGELTKADISYKNALTLKATDLRISAMNAMEEDVEIDSASLHPFSGSVSAVRLALRDSEGTAIRLDSTRNSFRIFPQKGEAKVPVLTLTSRNNKIFLMNDVNRAIISNADLKANAVLNTVERRQKMKAFRDSLARVYPGVPKDSLFRHMMAQKGSKPQMPEWMKEEDFRKQDIDISLDNTLARYFRNWDLKGSLNVGSGIMMTPYFPLKNILQGFDLNFTNDKVAVERLDLKSGRSNISATGKLTGLKRALLGRRGALKLDVDIKSDGMDAYQLLTAYTKGSSFNPNTLKGKSEVSDEEFLDQVIIDTSATVSPALIVIPANLVADISLDASDIRYADLHMKKVSSGLIVKERCVQITDTKAITNMGDITLEGFYATRSKEDLKTGFNINFKDITAEKAINLMPSIDTIMPLLKSFGGLLNCEFAATAQLDTNMNLVMPSIDGVMRIAGKDLTVRDNDMFKSLAKTLMFRNKKEGRINKMTVEGVIKDNRLEVFPFIIEMDRYILGLSGVQNMDMSFRYHASLIKSPFLIKLGIDLYGPDFDNTKFKIGKAKYKDRNVPVFSTVIDQTKINLVESIRNIFDKGVDFAIQDNSEQEAIEEHKKKIGYVQAIDQKLEELSTEEQESIKTTQDEQSGIHRDGSEDNAVQ